jgi:hypothetical protein
MRPIMINSLLQPLFCWTHRVTWSDLADYHTALWQQDASKTISNNRTQTQKKGCPQCFCRPNQPPTRDANQRCKMHQSRSAAHEFVLLPFFCVSASRVRAHCETGRRRGPRHMWQCGEGEGSVYCTTAGFVSGCWRIDGLGAWPCCYTPPKPAKASRI